MYFQKIEYSRSRGITTFEEFKILKNGNSIEISFLREMIDNSNDWSDIMDTYSKTMEYFGGKSKCRRSWKESEGSVIPQFNIVAPHRYTIDLPPRLISLSTEERKGERSVRWDGSSCICEPSNHFSVSSGIENVRSTRSTRIFSRFAGSLRVDSLHDYRQI